MDADPDKQTENPRPSGIGPGERLQAARIKKGLSVEDVANRMHLSTSILEAIEDNNFDEVTAPIFVKGYLRAYARIVALDEDEMIEQYLQGIFQVRNLQRLHQLHQHRHIPMLWLG